jgi:hypothetical protein
MRVSDLVRCPPRPPRVDPRPPRPLLPWPLPLRPVMVSLIFLLYRFWAAPIRSGCFWLTMFLKSATDCLYVIVIGIQDNSISNCALVGVRKSALILSINIRIFMESECTIQPSRLTYALNALVRRFSNSVHHI